MEASNSDIQPFMADRGNEVETGNDFDGLEQIDEQAKKDKTPKPRVNVGLTGNRKLTEIEEEDNSKAENIEESVDNQGSVSFDNTNPTCVEFEKSRDLEYIEKKSLEFIQLTTSLNIGSKATNTLIEWINQFVSEENFNGHTLLSKYKSEKLE
ncbi:hypothetical protein G6F56_004513 [Rhizopus delemar]|nr:hypothetical protein G6F56_004513 [Rhizopus delemar]